MMVSCLLTASMALATPAAAPQIRTSATTFEMTLGASPEQLEQSETHTRRGDVVVWLPGAHLGEHRFAVDAGPVATAMVHTGARGTAVTLVPRGGADIKGHLALLSAPAGLLRVGPPLAAVAPAPPVGAPVQPVAEASRGTLPPDAFAGLTQQTPPVSTVVPAVVLGFLGLVALAWRGYQRHALPRMDESIRLVAVRSLGGKHRLCLVEAGGERLLLAASDKEVTLLSHLGAAAPAAEAIAASVVDAPKQVGPAAESSDVMGILRLRPQRRFEVVQ